MTGDSDGRKSTGESHPVGGGESLISRHDVVRHEQQVFGIVRVGKRRRI